MNNKDLLLLIGLGILFICHVIGCFGHQEGYSSSDRDEKLKQECELLEKKKKPTPAERMRHHLDKELYEAKFISEKGELNARDKSIIEAEIKSIEKQINANDLDDACDRVIKYCHSSKEKRKEFQWKLDNEVANYGAMRGGAGQLTHDEKVTKLML